MTGWCGKGDSGLVRGFSIEGTSPVNIREQHTQTIDQLVDDMQIMTAAVPLHPLCCDYAAALAAAHTAPVTLCSLCLAHLDEQSLNAAADALYALGMQNRAHYQ